VTELEKLMKQIRELRISMIEIKEGKTFTDPAVKIASQMLEAVFLKKYQELLLETYFISDDRFEHLVGLGNIEEPQKQCVNDT
jgi:ABC-type dipeptide/oligopeptide/nickel transport system ATPase component